MLSTENDFGAVVEDFIPCRHDINETRQIPSENTKISQFLIKPLLESNCKRSSKGAKPDNSKLKPDPLVEKLNSVKFETIFTNTL